MDFYKKKSMIKTELMKYLLEIQENPNKWNSKKFDQLLKILSTEHGFSIKVIEKELGELGLRYNREEGILEKSISAYEKIKDDQ